MTVKKILPTIESPKDVKSLSLKEMQQLALELRERIIEVLSINGGHLASNLGSVELSIALHKVFNSPEDKFIWDVSHQTYSHKILTGRNNRFNTIRQFKGLCGFSHPKESPHDHFYAGHAGTALSLALGVAKNRDLTKRQEYIIPIIGDATLTCGMSLEALNNISKDMKRFIIVLNDNAMSISENVGAITQILSRMISNPLTNKIHQELDSFMSKIPALGTSLTKQGHKITESIKNLFSPASFFEQYGVAYIGPVDGHDIKKLVETFEGLKDSSWPVVVHILTNKGQGMEEAIKNPISYHGVAPFDPNTGKIHPQPSSKPTFPKIFGKHILEMAENDPSLIVVTPAMSAGSQLDPFMKKFPERCLDVGIAESHSVTFSGGIAYGKKMKVLVSIYSTFLQRAFDNLFHDICIQELPVVFAIDRGGISGPDGTTHHGIYDISFLNAMPNMIISQPRNGKVLKELLESSFTWGRPAAIRYPNMAVQEPEGQLQYRKLGKGEVLEEGEDVLILALGHMNQTALEVREQLAKKGISVAVVDPIFVKPLDTDLLCRLLINHTRIVTLEEHSVVSGMGSIVNNFLMTQGFNNVQVLNLGVPETFLQHGSYKDIIDEIGLTADKITKKIVTHFGLKTISECVLRKE